MTSSGAAHNHHRQAQKVAQAVMYRRPTGVRLGVLIGIRKWIYIALFFVAAHTQGARAWIEQSFSCKLPPCLP